MSYTEIYKVCKNGDVVRSHEIRNSWLGGMYIWRELEEKYLPSLPIPQWFFSSDYYSRFSAFNSDKTQEVWDMYDQNIMKPHEDIVIYSTYDGKIFMRKDFDLLIESFQEFIKEFDKGNLPDQIKAFKELKEDEDCIGIAWNQTSVVCGTWDVYEDEEDESRPVNINTDTVRFFVYQPKTNSNEH